MRVIMFQISGASPLQRLGVMTEKNSEPRIHNVTKPHVLHTLGVERGADKIRAQKNLKQDSCFHVLFRTPFQDDFIDLLGRPSARTLLNNAYDFPGPQAPFSQLADKGGHIVSC